MEATLNGPTGRTTLGPEILTIGRMPGNQLLITDSQSSGHHAEIRPEGQAYSIIDLGSTNGTFVNEQQLAPQVPRQLISGDRIRIGQTVLIYEVSGADAFASTAYINQPAKGDRPAFEPTFAVPPPSFDGYGANEQQNSQPPPPPPPGYQAAFNPAGSAPPVPPGYVPVPAQKKRGRGLWITLGIIAAVLLLSCIVVVAIAYANRSTPEKTLTTFCSDLKNGDYHDAYQQLSAGAQGTKSEAAFTRGFEDVRGVKDCTYANVSDNGSTGSATVTLIVNLFPTTPINYDGRLVDENGTWKIDSLVAKK